MLPQVLVMSRAAASASGITPVDDPERKCLKCGDHCPGFAPHFWRLVPSPLSVRAIIPMGIMVTSTYPEKTNGSMLRNVTMRSTEHVGCTTPGFSLLDVDYSALTTELCGINQVQQNLFKVQLRFNRKLLSSGNSYVITA